MKKYFQLLIFCLIGLLPLGCNGNAGTQGAYGVVSPAPGTWQTFNVHIFNGTQWELTLDPLYTGAPVLIIPVGTEVIVPIGFLPSSVSVTVATYAVPSYVYPTKTFILGIDYGGTTTDLIVNFP